MKSVAEAQAAYDDARAADTRAREEAHQARLHLSRCAGDLDFARWLAANHGFQDARCPDLGLAIHSINGRWVEIMRVERSGYGVITLKWLQTVSVDRNTGHLSGHRRNPNARIDRPFIEPDILAEQIAAFAKRSVKP